MSTRSELKENILAAKVESGLKWALERKTQVLTFLGIAVAAILIGSVFILRGQERRAENWTRMAQAQNLLVQGNFEGSKQILQTIKSNATSSGEMVYSDYYLGDVYLQEGDYQKAVESFSAAVDHSQGQPVHALAMANLGFALEQSGDASAAADTYQAFMDQHGDHFMAARVQLSLGRSLMAAGQTEPAREALGQLIDLYPTSIWAEKARRILDKSNSR